MALSDHMTEQATAVATKASAVATYGGATSAFIFGKFTANDIAALTGAAVAVIGLGFTIWFQWRRDKREREAAERR